jgi:hypothetical protein
VFRVRADRFDDEVKSISVDPGCPLHRMAASGRGEMGSRERVVPVNNLRIEIRMRSTAYDAYSVRGSWSIWRKLDSSASGGKSARRI